MDDALFVGNEYSGIVHKWSCPFVLGMHWKNIVPFHHLYDAESLEYAECQYCINKWRKPEQINLQNFIKSKRREKGCLVCGEMRGVQLAHVIPKRLGGIERMTLCPSCHWNYDHDLLTESERATMDKEWKQPG